MEARRTIPTALIADAEFYICRVLEAKLAKDERYKTITVTSGTEALQAALQHNFDVVLWDMRLRDTFGLLPRLRALCPDAILFLMTTDDRPMANPEIEHLDVHGVLVKPFGLDTLVEQIDRAMTAPPPPGATASMDLSRVGQRLTLAQTAGQCVTRVLDRYPDSFVVLGPPRVCASSGFVRGARVTVQIPGEDALYSFESRLLRVGSDPLVTWEFSLPRNIRRSQRRRHPRLALRLAVSVTGAWDGNGTEVPDSDPVYAPMGAAGITEDLSMGGCTLIADQPLPVGVDVMFDLRDGAPHPMTGRGRVLRLQYLPPADHENRPSNRYQIALQFTQLGLATRRRLRSLLS
jgi:CheY-like chemotaxis protein/c-di-GMP-binding flagellar brake protein YcgR